MLMDIIKHESIILNVELNEQPTSQNNAYYEYRSNPILDILLDNQLII